MGASTKKYIVNVWARNQKRFDDLRDFGLLVREMRVRALSDLEALEYAAQMGYRSNDHLRVTARKLN